MSCPQCLGIEREFNRKSAEAELKRYRKNGIRGNTQRLIEILLAEGVQGASLLDIGGGVGAIQHALLKAGASQAMDVDASSAYLEAAKGEARRLGLEEKISFYQGDFVRIAREIPPADIVTLDRVICCYDDMEQLVRLSSQRARRLYALIYPLDRWWTKMFVWAGNTWLKIRHSSFRIFVHSTAKLEALLREAGLERHIHTNDGFWQIAVYTRMKVEG